MSIAITESIRIQMTNIRSKCCSYLAYVHTLNCTKLFKAFPGIFTFLNIIDISQIVVFIKKRQKKSRNKPWHPELFLNRIVQL